MGLTRLRVVEPAADDLWRIKIAAPRSEQEIQAIERFTSLSEALHDVHYTVGLTARPRKANYTVQHPREAALDLLHRATQDNIALLLAAKIQGFPIAR